MHERRLHEAPSARERLVGVRGCFALLDEGLIVEGGAADANGASRRTCPALSRAAAAHGACEALPRLGQPVTGLSAAGVRAAKPLRSGGLRRRVRTDDPWQGTLRQQQAG